jgi:hypothetical protein
MLFMCAVRCVLCVCEIESFLVRSHQLRAFSGEEKGVKRVKDMSDAICDNGSMLCCRSRWPSCSAPFICYLSLPSSPSCLSSGNVLSPPGLCSVFLSFVFFLPLLLACCVFPCFNFSFSFYFLSLHSCHAMPPIAPVKVMENQKGTVLQ